MPLKLKSSANADIHQTVIYWMELLSAEKYTEAFELTWHDPYYQWTPSLLEKVINGYGLPDQTLDVIHKVTSPQTAVLDINNQNIYKDISLFDTPLSRNHGSPEIEIIGDVFYDLPIDGHWSDLTASFRILQRADFFGLELNDIHVL